MTSSLELLDWIAGHEVLSVRAWPGTEVAGRHDLCSEYVEVFWLPILGPSALLALRRLCGCIAGAGEGAVPLAEFARCLGLGAGLGRRAPVVRTLARLVDFRLARIGDDHFEVCSAVPSLNPKQLRRLPAVLLALHEQSYATDGDDTTRVDASLLRCGPEARQVCAPSLSPLPHRSSR